MNEVVQSPEAGTKLVARSCCPECGSLESFVTDSRGDNYGSIRRRRECSNGHRYTTVEISQVEYKRLRRLDVTVRGVYLLRKTVAACQEALLDIQGVLAEQDDRNG